ncbi:kinase-like domain-containing protein [Schizophyllum fasciatum]
MPLDVQPPPYPQDLPSWHELAVEDFQKPWLYYEPFLRARGYILQSSADFDSDATKDCFPTKPAVDPFHPKDDEDFVHRIDWDTHRTFFNLPSPQMRAKVNAALDPHYRMVIIKAVHAESSEWRIINFLSSGSRREDPRNHTIPLVEIIHAREYVFIVQACWDYSWAFPPFDSGLCFMHEQGISHGDIHSANVLWNHDGARPSSFLQDPCPKLHSTFDARYAFIDFGAAIHSLEDADRYAIPRTYPPEEYAAPEQILEIPIDRFAADVYNLGRVMEKELYNAFKQQHPIAHEMFTTSHQYFELIKMMIHELPGERPSTQRALLFLRDHRKEMLGTGTS